MTSSPTTMRAVRLSAPGPVDNLRLTTLPLPPERDGWVRIRVEAFGTPRSCAERKGPTSSARGVWTWRPASGSR
jgi:hypothetical protein